MDTSTLVRKEVQLARQEILEGVTGKAMAAGAFGAAAVFLLLGVVFLGAAATVALERVIQDWAARLVVFGGFLVLATGAVLFGISQAKKPVTPEETKRTVKEDLEWAREQLKR